MLYFDVEGSSVVSVSVSGAEEEEPGASVCEGESVPPFEQAENSRAAASRNAITGINIFLTGFITTSPVI